jgi:hypothetical protein
VAVQEAAGLVGRPRHAKHSGGDHDGGEDSHERSTCERLDFFQRV